MGAFGADVSQLQASAKAYPNRAVGEGPGQSLQHPPPSAITQIIATTMSILLAWCHQYSVIVHTLSSHQPLHSSDLISPMYVGVRAHARAHIHTHHI